MVSVVRVARVPRAVKGCRLTLKMVVKWRLVSRERLVVDMEAGREVRREGLEEKKLPSKSLSLDGGVRNEERMFDLSSISDRKSVV